MGRVPSAINHAKITSDELGLLSKRLELLLAKSFSYSIGLMTY